MTFTVVTKRGLYGRAKDRPSVFGRAQTALTQALKDDAKPEWDASYARGENPDPSAPGGPAANAS